ncbi:MAG: carboxypeptidase-like regulatory domain-containing protein, partial [Paludibacteraceae bacterium]|nr:carboxypeptidase-like regulatory domain-containing protein [Paludibacteraceae bacterium]
MKKLLVSLLLVLGISAQSLAAVVSGTVRDAQGEPLIGVSVVVVGSTTGTITDMDGMYALEAEPTASLLFSYVGYKNVTKAV